jgi:hypothetical protein
MNKIPRTIVIVPVIALALSSFYSCAELRCSLADARCVKAEQKLNECKNLQNKEFDNCTSRARQASNECMESENSCNGDASEKSVLVNEKYPRK